MMECGGEVAEGVLYDGFPGWSYLVGLYRMLGKVDVGYCIGDLTKLLLCYKSVES